MVIKKLFYNQFNNSLYVGVDNTLNFDTDTASASCENSSVSIYGNRLKVCSVGECIIKVLNKKTGVTMAYKCFAKRIPDYFTAAYTDCERANLAFVARLQ